MNKNVDLKTFWTQNYTGPGIKIPFHYEVLFETHDEPMYDSVHYIKQERLTVSTGGTLIADTTRYELFQAKMSDAIPILDLFGDPTGEYKYEYRSEIDFNLLFTNIGKYRIQLTLMDDDNRVWTKTTDIVVCDTDGIQLKFYKVVHNEPDTQYDIPANTICFSRNDRTAADPKYQTMYLCGKNDPNNSIQLNNVLIFEGEVTNQYLKDNYDIIVRDNKATVSTERKIYTVCISHEFWFKPVKSQLPAGTIYLNEYRYFPEYHHLEELVGETAEDFEITDLDTIAIVPEMRFAKRIEDPQWTFINRSTNQHYEFSPVYEPFFSTNDNTLLPKGYYDVIFKFKLGDEVHEVKYESVFRKI